MARIPHFQDAPEGPRSRVQITYEMETYGGLLQRELPLVVGVLADLAGCAAPERPLPPLGDSRRRFVAIDRDRLDAVMASLAPRLVLEVDDTLAGDGSQIPVVVEFAGESRISRRPALRGKSGRSGRFGRSEADTATYCRSSTSVINWKSYSRRSSATLISSLAC